MKIRNGFVSNSSSSSFVCSISGEAFEVCDNEYDGYVCECPNGHIMLQHHLDIDESEIGIPQNEKNIVEELLFDGDEIENITRVAHKYNITVDDVRGIWEKYPDPDDAVYGIPKITKEQCPICSMEVFNDGELLAALIANSGKTRHEIEEEFRNNGTYEEFRQLVRSVS